MVDGIVLKNNFGRFQKYLRSLRRGGFFKLEASRQPSVCRHKNHVVIY